MVTLQGELIVFWAFKRLERLHSDQPQQGCVGVDFAEQSRRWLERPRK